LILVLTIARPDDRPAEKDGAAWLPPTPSYDNVRVAINTVGEEGRGLHHTLSTLDGGRIGIAAISIGLAQAAFEYATAYAKERQAFGKPLADKQAIQWMLADAALGIEAARGLLYKAAWLKGQNRPFSQAAAMAKLFATEMAERAAATPSRSTAGTATAASIR
jgi:alkylation response protein AidB-like acyl-CoA dehydrogenase